MQHVVGHVRGGMAEMGRVVRRDPARIHSNDLAGFERLYPVARGVEQTHLAQYQRQAPIA